MTGHEPKTKTMMSVGLLPTIPYPGPNVGWTSRCLKCDSIVAPHYSTITNSIKNGLDRSCRVCGAIRGQQTRRASYFSTLPELLSHHNYELTGPYWDAKTKTSFQCTLCQEEVSTTSDSILTGARKCRCRKLPRKPLAEYFPALAQELYGEMNGRLSGDNIGTGMRSNVWWKCPDKGHIHDAAPANRIRGSICRYCSGNAAYPGESDLATSHPELCKELSPDQPLGVSASTLKSGSSVLANWICARNSRHIYPASPYERITRGAGCSYCAGKRVLIGDNDLLSTHPEIASEWDYAENFPQRPEFFTSGSNKEFYWRCSWNPRHSWKAMIGTRTKGHGCNQCARVKVGVNDLTTMAGAQETRRHLLGEWDASKNTKSPSEIAYADNSEYWWTCALGKHPPYLAKCSNRWFSLTGCPTCAPSAYSTSKPGRLYFLHQPDLGSFKIGITNLSTKTDRIKKFAGHGWNLEYKIDHEDGLIIKRLEKRLLFLIREVWNLPPLLGASEMRNMGGATETFSGEYASADEIRALIDFEFRDILQSTGI